MVLWCKLLGHNWRLQGGLHGVIPEVQYECQSCEERKHVRGVRVSQIPRRGYRDPSEAERIAGMIHRRPMDERVLRDAGFEPAIEHIEIE